MKKSTDRRIDDRRCICRHQVKEKEGQYELVGWQVSLQMGESQE